MPTLPGINPKVNVYELGPAERRLVDAFSVYFYITRVKTGFRYAGGEYCAICMRPTEEISTVLNVERELVAMFAPYDTFEARSLDSFESFYAELDDFRIDKTVRIFISDDPRIENKLRDFISKNPEYPIVIPFVSNEIRHNDFNQHLMRQIRSIYTIRDLFSYSNALRQEHFYFGRDSIINLVIDNHKSNQNSTIFGLRKSGKTSTIYAIERKAKALGNKSCKDRLRRSRDSLKTQR